MSLDLLRWYIAMGADEAIAETAQDRLAPAPSPPAAIAAPPRPRPARAAAPREAAPSVAPAAASSAAAAGARQAAAAATTLAELEAAVRAFEGCALKRTATNTVFAD